MLCLRRSLFVPGGHDAQRSLRVELHLHRADAGNSMATEVDAWSNGARSGRCAMAGDGCRGVWMLEVPRAPDGAYFRRLEPRSAAPGAKLRMTLDAISVP